MAYDNLHNIISKKQHVEQKGIQFDGVLKAGYELNYNYANNPFQISTLDDENYRTEATDAKELTKKEHKYEYDTNGNLVYINTERPKKDGTQTPKSTERKLLWDEENRLEAIDDNGFVSNYWYDAAGERTVKTSGESQEMYVNSVFSGGDTQTANFTAYINPYLVVSKGGNYTKHIYIGSQRIVSKLGDLDSYGGDPRRIEYAGANVDGASINYGNKYSALQQTIKDRYAAFEVEYYGKDNDDYVNGQGFCCDDSKTLKSFNPSQNDNPELYQYYYHSDHLGSSSLITNLDGEVVQHIEYVPFGEVFIEERNNTWNTPYLFNAKELDEETGLYYYGARYYDPRTSIFLSVDLLTEKFVGRSAYEYCLSNPTKLTDPTGNGPGDGDPALNASVSVKFNFKGGFSIGAGVGLSQRIGNFKPSLNISATFYNTGVGTRSGVLNGNDISYLDVAISPALTFGTGNYKPVTLNTFNNNSASGVMNNYKHSLTLGTNLVFNSEGRNQRVGYAGFRSGDVDFSFYNDIKFPLLNKILSDGDDRWWTGGGSLNIGPLSLKADVFTGERDINASYLNTEGERIWTPQDGNPAGGIHGTYQQTPFQKSFNNGQTIWGFRGWGAVHSGSGHMYPQSSIHNYLSGNLLFESKAKPDAQVFGRF